MARKNKRLSGREDEGGRRRTRAARVIAPLLIVAVLGAVAFYAYRRARATFENVGPILVRELERQLEREVAIGRVLFPRRGVVVLEAVAVARGQRLADGALARAERVEVRYDFWRWLRALGDVVGSVREVVVVAPWLYLERDRQGTLNVQRLFPPRPEVEPTRFRGRIVVRDGLLHVRDYRALFPRLPARNDVEAVNGWLDFSAFPQLTFAATGSIKGAHGGPFSADGYVEMRRGGWLTSLRATDVDAAYWSSYFLRTSEARLEEGRGDAAISLWREGRSASFTTRYSILLNTRQVVVETPRLKEPLRQVTGRAQIDPTGGSFQLSARLGGMPIAVEGRVVGFTEPHVSLQVRASSVTLAQARRVLPVTLPENLPDLGPASVSATVTGPLANPVATGTATLAYLRASGRTTRDLGADWHYQGGVLKLTDARVEGVKLKETRAWVDFRSEPVELFACGEVLGVSLAEWVQAPNGRIGGVASARFAFSGPVTALNGQVAFEVTPFLVNAARFARAEGQVRLRQGLVEVRRASVIDPAGVLTVTGTITPGGELALAVHASGVDLEPLLAPQLERTVRGTAYFRGKVGGTTDRPRLTGNLQIYGAQWDATRVDFIEGPITATPDILSTEHLTARLYPASLVVRGTIGNLRRPQPTLDLSAELEDLSVAQVLLVLERKEPIAGIVTSRLQISGTTEAPLVTGTVQVEDVVARGYDLGSLAARLRLTREALELQQLMGGTNRMTIAGSARLARAPTADPRTGGLGFGARSPLEATLAVRQLDLDKLNPEVAPYARLTGTLDEAIARVSGTLGRPRIEGTAVGRQLTVNGERFDSLAVAFRWADGEATVEEATLRAGDGTIRLVNTAWRSPQAAGPALEAAPFLEAAAQLEQFPVGRLLGVVRSSAFLATEAGRSTAEAVRGIPPTLSGALTAEVGVVQPRRGEPVRLTASGSIQGLTAPEIRVPRVPTTEETAAEPPVEEPATEPLVADVAVALSYEAGRLELTSLQATRGEASLTASGSVILAGGRPDPRGAPDPDGQFDLQIDAVSVPMHLLGTMVPDLYPVAGVGDLHVDVEGAVVSPLIRASADVDNPVLLGIPFTRLSFPLVVLREGRLQIEGARLTRVLQEREHQATLEGTLPFRWKPLGIPSNLPRNLHVQVPRQGLDIVTVLARIERPDWPAARLLQYLGQLQGLTGDLEARVTLAGTADRPRNRGDFYLAGVGFGFPGAESQLEQVNVHLAFEDDQLTVRQFVGRSSTGGSFTVSGAVNLGRPEGGQDPLDLSLELDDFKFRGRNLTGFLNERLGGTFSTVMRGRPEQSAPLRITGDLDAPLLSGAVLARDTSLSLPAAFPQPETAPVKPIVNPRFDMALLVGRNSWISNPSLRLQLVGQVPITGTLLAPQVRGRLLVERGTLTFPTARFRVVGEIEIAYAPALAAEGALPIRVDLVATTRVRGRDPATGASRQYAVTLVARGPLSPILRADPGAGLAPPSPARLGQLAIEASSDPPLAETQILALLGRVDALEEIFAGRTNVQDVLVKEFEQALTASVVPALFLPLEMAVEEMFGLQEFAIDLAFREPIQLRLGKQLIGGLWASYSRSLTGPLETEQFELQYRLSERLRFGYRLEQPFSISTWFFNGTFRF